MYSVKSTSAILPSSISHKGHSVYCLIAKGVSNLVWGGGYIYMIYERQNLLKEGLACTYRVPNKKGD